MSTWFHAAIIATCAAATVAVGVASAAVYADIKMPAAKKSDRLTVSASASANHLVVVEHREAGLSVITRVPAPVAD